MTDVDVFARRRELLARARAFAGYAVGDVDVDARAFGGKGAVGMRLEAALGLKPVHDDVDDPIGGVEVKTLPFRLRDDGAKVTEATFVTSASVPMLMHETWETSRVKKKLSCVLFIPIETTSQRIGTAFLYTPPPDDEAVLRADWEDLADLVTQGLGFAIRSQRGAVLHLRPKAKDASVTTATTTADGDDVVLRPQGFYLRARFTEGLLRAAFA